jgi:hypothetical protein
LGENIKHNGAPDVNEVKAIAVLLGAYNQYGRNIEIEKYYELKSKFANIVYELKSLI